jgi:hypothetical protein
MKYLIILLLIPIAGCVTRPVSHCCVKEKCLEGTFPNLGYTPIIHGGAMWWDPLNDTLTIIVDTAHLPTGNRIYLDSTGRIKPDSSKKYINWDLRKSTIGTRI